MLIPELYIEDQRVDLWDNETISLTDAIRNLRDPEKFFDAFTAQFSVPASKANNKIFTHYYMPEVNDGFDGTLLYDAEIRVSGFTWKKGQAKLNNVKLKAGKAMSYDIVFYGSMTKIKAQLQQTALNDLGYLDYLSHPYSGANVKAGFEIGLTDPSPSAWANDGTDIAASAAAADIVYPFISHTTQYVLDTTSTPTYVIHPIDITDDSEGLKYTDLKPAVRLTEIFNGIEQECGITFDTNGILGDTQFGNLWMWCHTAKGGIIGNDRNTSTWYFSDRTYSGATVDVTYGNEYFTIAGLSGGAHFDFSLATTITGAGNYDIRVIDQLTGAVRYEEYNASGSDTFTWTIYPNTGSNYFAPKVEIVSDGTITAIDIALTATMDLLTGTDPQGVYDYDSKTPNSYADIPANMPKISCIEFISGICKMFNLVIYADNDGVYYLEPMNTFYTGKSTRDITEFVDPTEENVAPPVPFDTIKLGFEEPDTFLMKERIDRVGETYGNESFSLGSIWEGNEYEVTVPFEKILFERMTDLNDGAIDTNMWAWCADQDGDPILTKPIIFHYNVAIPSAITSFQWDHAAVSSTTQAMCSNTVNDGTDWTLTFGSEYGEYTNQPILGDLFTEYWEDYITGVYDIRARLITLNATLPLSFILNYDMGDTILYKNREYFINEMTIDLQTGKADIELITKWL